LAVSYLLLSTDHLLTLVVFMVFSLDSILTKYYSPNIILGHNFQVIARSGANVDYNPKDVVAPKAPIRRDTVMVQEGGYIVLRFKADNPDKSSS